MNTQEALETLAAIINRGTYTGTIAEIERLGMQANQALEVLRVATAPSLVTQEPPVVHFPED